MVPKIGEHGLFEASNTNSKIWDAEFKGENFLHVFALPYLLGKAFIQIYSVSDNQKKKNLVNRAEHSWPLDVSCLNSGFRSSHRSVVHMALPRYMGELGYQKLIIPARLWKHSSSSIISLFQMKLGAVF